MSDTHEIRELRFKVKQLSQQNGRQGETIHRLRADIAEIRELGSKIERGELRRLQRFEETAKAQYELDRERLEHASEYIRELKEKLAASDAR